MHVLASQAESSYRSSGDGAIAVAYLSNDVLIGG
jgi:hypothetical protein